MEEQIYRQELAQLIRSTPWLMSVLETVRACNPPDWLVGAGVTCVALSLNLADFAWLRLAPQERFHHRLAQHLAVAERVRAAEPIGPVLGSGPIANYVRVPAGPGWALVGDASLHQDPWSGLGMDMASVHATFLTEALLAWFGQLISEPEALTRYHRRRNDHALNGYHRTVSLASDLRQLQR